MSDNLWGETDFSNVNLEDTSHIYEILNEQCFYLKKMTHDKVFAIFGEIKLQNISFNMVKNLANIINASNISKLKIETIDGEKTGLLNDASDMFYRKKYGFEVFTNTYKFRLFELIMTPAYPVEISIDEGINNSIYNKLNEYTKKETDSNCYKIYSETDFCKLIKLIFQSQKVRYIIKRLETIADEDDLELNSRNTTKIILCEGQSDEIILQAIANKMNINITTVIANGKNSIPNYIRIIKNNTPSHILIVVDSDGDEEKTKTELKSVIDAGYQIAIINGQIEDWFSINKSDFSRIKLIQSIDQMVERLDFKKLQAEDKAFNAIINFMLS